MSLTTSPLAEEALRAIDVLLAFWDQEYFAIATGEPAFTPLLPRSCTDALEFEAAVEEATRELKKQKQSIVTRESVAPVSKNDIPKVEEVAQPQQLPVEASQPVEIAPPVETPASTEPNPEPRSEIVSPDVTTPPPPLEPPSAPSPHHPATIPSTHQTPTTRPPYDKFDYTFRAGRGGKGWWKYVTKPRGSNTSTQQVQFLTVWSTPTPKSPIPRATAGVWFVYEKLDEEMSKLGSRVLASKLSNVRTAEMIIHTANLHYRYEHSHQTHTIAIPSDLKYLPFLLTEHTAHPTHHRFSAPYIHLPELISASLTVSRLVENGHMLHAAPVASDPATIEKSEPSDPSHHLKFTGNGIPWDILQELARTENYPVLTSSQVMMRHHLTQVAAIPVADDEFCYQVVMKQAEQAGAVKVKREEERAKSREGGQRSGESSA
ncbi:hypothetical protein HDU98_001549 [Podochytrium sp. JEL0797]|nr:hypothetical protein HDU98_001549 [Podochytrium sp. JEL0797]